MKTENEIKQLPLIERQKLVIELKQIGTNDKAYANAKAIIDLITSMKDWDEPETIEVKNIAGHEITVNDKKIVKDGTAKVFPWEYLALARFLQPTDEDEMEVIHKAYLPKPVKEVSVAAVLAPAAGVDEKTIAKIVSQTVAETLKALGLPKAAAVLLLFLGMMVAAQAQTTTYAVGGPGQYGDLIVAGLNGGTNWVNGTNTYSAGVTNLTYTTNANWSVVNGLSTNTPTITTNTSITYPSVVSMANFDLADIYMDFALSGAGTAACSSSWDYSDDLQHWRLNALVVTCTANGTTETSTNMALSSFAPGFLRLDQIWYASTTVFPTNLWVTVNHKTSKTGP